MALRAKFLRVGFSQRSKPLVTQATSPGFYKSKIVISANQ
jgi:hypothetical protein